MNTWERGSEGAGELGGTNTTEMAERVTASCPTCAAALRHRGWTRSERGARVPLLRCGSCGLSAVEWVESEEQRGEFFAAYSYESEAAWEVSQATAISLENWVRGMEPFRKLNRWLDIGCGAGALLRTAAAHGWQAEGTELSTVAAQRLQSAGVTVHVGTTESLQLPENAYDVVTMTEVLEHLPRPELVVRDAFRLLRPGGCFFLTTPNYNCVRRRLFGPEEVLVPPDHLFSFNPVSLRRLLRATGFTPVRVWTEGINPFLLLQRLRERGRPPETGHPWAGQWEQTTDLRLRAHQRPAWRALKQMANATMRITGGGDTLKATAIKPTE